MRSAFFLSVGVALGVAASGFASQASDPSRIVACVHQKGGGLYVASKCAARDKHIALSVTAQGQAAPPGARLFAQVRTDGTINVSSPGVKASQFAGHLGTYRIDFGQDISHCAATATLGAVPYFGSPGATSTRALGFAVVDLSAPGFTFPNGYLSGDTAQVEIRADGTRAAAPFYIVVTC
jgi:hypothetical protein